MAVLRHQKDEDRMLPFRIPREARHTRRKLIGVKNRVILRGIVPWRCRGIILVQLIHIFPASTVPLYIYVMVLPIQVKSTKTPPAGTTAREFVLLPFRPIGVWAAGLLLRMADFAAGNGLIGCSFRCTLHRRINLLRLMRRVTHTHEF